jgi:hypothetical protein
MLIRRISLVPVLISSLALLLAGCASHTELEAMRAQLLQEQLNSQQRIAQLEEELAKAKIELHHSIVQANTPVQATQTSILSLVEQLRRQQTYMLVKLDATERLLDHAQQSNQTNNNQTNSPALLRLSFEVQAMREALTNDLDVKLPPTPVMLANATLPGWWSSSAIQWISNDSNADALIRSSTAPGSQTPDWSRQLETSNRSEHSK